MSLDSQLDALIREARRAEAPPPHAREQVRRQLERQLQSNASDPAFEEAVLPRATSRSLPRALTWGAPLAVIGAAALAGSRLSPQPADPLVQVPAPAATVADRAAAPEMAETAAAETETAAAQPAGAEVAAAKTAEADTAETAAAVKAETKPADSKARAARMTARRASKAAGASPDATRAVAAQPPAATSSDLLAESRALARVQQALRDGQPARALQLLTEQERQFAHGALHEERAAARAMALCNAGPVTAGRSAAADFATRYPKSVLAARVREACGHDRAKPVHDPIDTQGAPR